jgi:hypothetical protein
MFDYSLHNKGKLDLGKIYEQNKKDSEKQPAARSNISNYGKQVKGTLLKLL